MKNLVIVESLAKAKTIEKYLNSSKALKSLGSFKVVASFGHIDNLPPKELGIDIENGFGLQYQLLADKKKVTDDLKAKAKDADVVWLASDADYEGEKIADSLKTFLKLKNYKRVTFTEITQQALERSLQNPRKIDESLVDAQETRRILDRLVGYKLSPLLWKKYSTGGASALSAGRVQSAVMHALIEKEKAISAFQSESYWYFLADFNLHTKIEDVKLYYDTTVHKVDNIDTARKLLKALKNKFSVKDIKAKTVRQSPDAPYITSSFQQDAFSKLGLGIKRSMQIAQELYENGHITYMRTDSYNISDVFKETVHDYVSSTYGEEYWEGTTKKKKTKNAQEAHEAIRPTHIEQVSLPTDQKFTMDHKKVYDLIWKRTISSLMKPAVFDELLIKIADASFTEKMYFLATVKKLKFNGYLVVFGFQNETYSFDDIKQQIKTITCEVITAKNTWSNPPARYNDSSLIKMMETEGIGRPSTYASVLQKLTEKTYVIKTDISGEQKQTTNIIYKPGKPISEQVSHVLIGAEKTRMVPTEIGKEIDVYLSDKFPYIVDKTFTSTLEGDLDLIAEGDRQKIEVLNVFWSRFGKDVLREGGDLKGQPKKKLETESKEYVLNGVAYKVRIAKYGPVIEYLVDGQKKYIGITQYLKYMKKEYTDIDTNDISFLLRFPIMKKTSKGENVQFLMGPYGIYLKSSKGNHKIPLKMILEFIQSNGNLDPSTITKIVEYEKKTNEPAAATEKQPVKRGRLSNTKST